MLVISREAGESIHVHRADQTCLITVQRVRGDEAWIIIASSNAKTPGVLDCLTKQMRVDATHRISDEIELAIVDIRSEQARLGITAPRDAVVHRFEVYEAIRRENKHAADKGRDNPFDSGPDGAPVPSSPKPKPPTLDAHAKPPTEDQE